MKEKIGVDKRARRKLIIASTLCVLFMIGEIIGKVFYLKSKRNIDSIKKLRKSIVTGDVRKFTAAVSRYIDMYMKCQKKIE